MKPRDLHCVWHSRLRIAPLPLVAISLLELYSRISIMGYTVGYVPSPIYKRNLQ